MSDSLSPETLARHEATIHRVVGPTILLGSGTYFDYESPETSEITIEDVAYGLAHEGRFSGQCVRRSNGRRCLYVVAQHCVLASHLVPAGHEYDALMHEVGEAPCGDMSSPLKSICPDFKAIEKRAEAALLERFRVPMRDKQLIKEYDIVMLAWERRDLLPWNGERWGTETAYQIPDQTLVPWSPRRAAREFLFRFREVAPDDVLREAGMTRPGALSRLLHLASRRLPL